MRRSYFWVLLFIAFGIFCHFAKEVSGPFVLAFVLAYLLNPVVRGLEKWGICRSIGVVLLTAAMSIIIGIMFVFVWPLVFNQLLGLIISLPDYFDTVLSLVYGLMGEHTNVDVSTWVRRHVFDDSAVSSYVPALYRRLVYSKDIIFNYLAVMFLTPVVTFYLLRDWDLCINFVSNLIPRYAVDGAKEIAGNIDRMLSAYIRGQLNICVVLGLFYSIGLSVIGLDYGFTVGMIIGAVSFIPYVGVSLGFVFSVILGLIQFHLSVKVLLIVLMFALGCCADWVYLTPRFVGKNIGLHPVVILFSIMLFGSLFGFFGVLMAVPMTAVIFAFLRFLHSIYIQSTLYCS